MRFYEIQAEKDVLNLIRTSVRRDEATTFEKMKDMIKPYRDIPNKEIFARYANKFVEVASEGILICEDKKLIEGIVEGIVKANKDVFTEKYESIDKAIKKILSKDKSWIELCDPELEISHLRFVSGFGNDEGTIDDIMELLGCSK